MNTDIDLVRLACERRQGKLIILSTVLEQPEKEFQYMTKQIQNSLVPLCPVIIGGRGAAKFSHLLEEHGITYIEQVQHIQSLRRPILNFDSIHQHYSTTIQKEFTA